MPAGWIRAPRQLRLIFLATMLLLLATLVWLGWRMVQQDGQLAAQRLAERNEATADLAVAALERRLAVVERSLADLLTAGEPPANSSLAPGALWVRFEDATIRAWPHERLTYYPELQDPSAPPDKLFRVADERAYAHRDHAGAISALREHAASSNEIVRAAALARIAHNQFLGGRPADALRTFEQLASLDSVPVAGMPAALAAGLGRLGVLESQKDQQGVKKTAEALDRDLHAGRWPITAATYRYVSQEIARWIVPDGRARARVSLAEAFEELWDRRLEASVSTGDRASVVTSAGPVLWVTRRSGPTTAVFLADHRFLEKEWLTPAGLRVALTDRRGRLVVGTAPSPESRPAARPASATGLPWTVQALTIDDDQDTVRRRRMLLLAGLVVLVALIVTGGWFIGHSVARELEVARLQSDFVAAVSHEFRTPLTTLCQLSELLRRGRVRGDEDRQAYYELLHTESHRLRHLVEGVLNFGRVEGGRMPLEFRRVDLAALVQQSAAEFAKAPQAATHKLDVTTQGAPAVRGSEEALRCVIWNLLENAVKYSPDGERVQLEIVPNGHHVEIAVRDHGIGIPPREQRRIFEKFVRGSAARERNIRGTGLGLAIARQIVRAHGGDITVESEVDEGSTFRVRLPKETAV